MRVDNGFGASRAAGGRFDASRQMGSERLHGRGGLFFLLLYFSNCKRLSFLFFFNLDRFI